MLEKKHIPLVIGGAAALSLVTLSCLCCGIAGWIFPSSSPASVSEVSRASEQEAAEPRKMPSLPTLEDYQSLVAEGTHERDVQLLKDAIRVGHALPDLLPDTLQLDQLGDVRWKVEVQQVIDSENMVLSVPRKPTRLDEFPGTLSVWTTHFSTGPYVDDSRFELSGIFVVAGKKQHLGRTMFVLHHIDPAAAREARAAFAYPSKKSK